MAVNPSWKIPGLYKADAAKVYTELQTLGDNFTPEEILDLARDPNLELHKCFEWDNAKAAEKYRLQQARQLVCHLVTSESTGNKTTAIPVRLFHQADGPGYKPLSVIVQSPDSYQAMLQRCANDLRAMKTKYGSLSEFQDVWDLIH